MDEIIREILTTNSRLVTVLVGAPLLFLVAALVAVFSKRLAHLALGFGSLAPARRRPTKERVKTLESLVASAITVSAFFLAALATLSLILDTTTLLWMIGLFSAAFGFGAKNLVTDFLAGASYIFRDTFDLSEKVEFNTTTSGTVQGIVEHITLRHTEVRSPSGELFTVPNGEIGVVRNFSRARFSSARATLYVNPSDLDRTVNVLLELGKEAAEEMEQLLEPWQVVPTSDLVSDRVELEVIAKVQFGSAPAVKVRMIRAIHERLHLANISLLA